MAPVQQYVLTLVYIGSCISPQDSYYFLADIGHTTLTLVVGSNYSTIVFKANPYHKIHFLSNHPCHRLILKPVLTYFMKNFYICQMLEFIFKI